MCENKKYSVTFQAAILELPRAHPEDACSGYIISHFRTDLLEDVEGFVRCLTADDWKKIMNGEEIEL